MPMIGRIVPEKNDENVRELIEGNYRIIYQLSDKERIEVLICPQFAKDNFLLSIT
jgi:toxin ParE1/3/4